MFERIRRGWHFSVVLLQAWLSPAGRALVREMFAFEKALPPRFDQPLPVMMSKLTPEPRPETSPPSDDVRQLADAVAAWRLRSQLGICLRRSLLRYYFLRQAGLPVTIVFGARIKGEQEGGGLGGHAWLTLNGRPYYENPQDYRDFVKMFSYPEPIEPAASSPQSREKK